MAPELTPFWVLPLQIVATMAPSINCGGSVLHSPIVMPMLQMSEIPAVYRGKQNAFLLRASEKYFPPLSMLSIFSNMILLLSSFLTSNADPTWAGKWPFYAAALFANLATTFYALKIMAPHNSKIKACAKSMECNGEDDKAVAQFRQLQDWWIKNNYGRAFCMISGAFFSMYALTS